MVGAYLPPVCVWCVCVCDPLLGSQFFLNVADNKNLDWFSRGESKHPVFGKTVDKASQDLCVKISRVRTRDENPVQPIRMDSVTIDMGGAASAASAGGAAGSKYFYLDAARKEQGPFGLDEMKAWYSGGFFPPTHKVRKDGERTYKDLKDHAEIAGGPRGSQRYAPY